MPRETRQKFLKRVLIDTGDFAREVLGYNYDEDEGGKRVNVGKGGIVKHGKTQECVELLDSRELHFKLILMPRESRKSSIAQAFVVRNIMRNPDVRIFYGARTQPMVEEKVLAVRNQLERPEVTALFGEQRGPLWEADRFTVAGRNRVGLMNPTVQTFSFDAVPHGGRADIVILDDFIDETNCTNPEQIEKSKAKWQAIQPLVAKGGQLIVIGTVWDDDDLYAMLEGSPLFAPPNGGQVVCGAGVDIYYDENGIIRLKESEEGIQFPHLTVDYLEKKLWGMISQQQSPVHFQRQYLNQRATDELTTFRREDFRPVKWDPTMEKLTGYLLTDTATSKKKEGSYSVICYIGLDAYDHIYLLDMRVGRWSQDEFIDEFFGVLELWQQRVNHAGEGWEKAQLSEVYLDAVINNSRSRKLDINPIMVSRSGRSDSKPERILRMQPVMRNRRFWVCNTVPGTFEDVDGTKILYDAEGHYEARTKTHKPAGYLIDTFLRPAEKKDGADCIAMTLEYHIVKGKKPQRYFSHKTYRPKRREPSLTEVRERQYHQREYASDPQGGDWWTETLNGLGF